MPWIECCRAGLGSARDVSQASRYPNPPPDESSRIQLRLQLWRDGDAELVEAACSPLESGPVWSRNEGSVQLLVERAHACSSRQLIFVDNSVFLRHLSSEGAEVQR